jgi:hypothetical protein
MVNPGLQAFNEKQKKLDAAQLSELDGGDCPPEDWGFLIQRQFRCTLAQFIPEQVA